jgi:hypothetical protein
MAQGETNMKLTKMLALALVLTAPALHAAVVEAPANTQPAGQNPPPPPPPPSEQLDEAVPAGNRAAPTGGADMAAATQRVNDAANGVSGALAENDGHRSFLDNAAQRMGANAVNGTGPATQSRVDATAMHAAGMHTNLVPAPARPRRQSALIPALAFGAWGAGAGAMIFGTLLGAGLAGLGMAALIFGLSRLFGGGHGHHERPAQAHNPAPSGVVGPR